MTSRFTGKRLLLVPTVIGALSLHAQVTPNQAAEQSVVGAQRISPPALGTIVPATPDTLRGSVPEGQATSQTVQLSLRDAIQRGLRQNLGVIVGQHGTQRARVERLRAFNALLPTVTTRTTYTSQQVNLRAFGFPGFPGVPGIVGPFSVYDTRAYLTQNVLDFNAIRNRRAADASTAAADLDLRDVRDQVVLGVVSLYLTVITGQARADSIAAQLRSAQSLFQQAQTQKQAGTVAGISVLRAQVERQTQQQRLIASQNDIEKAKLNLARAIGLPLGQPFALTDKLPYTPAAAPTVEEGLRRAYASRPDLQAAEARLRSAELARKAVEAESYPTVVVDANYGAIGRALNDAHGTYNASVGVRIPVYQGTRLQADKQQADTLVAQRRSERDNLRGQIDADVRSALLDIRSAGQAVEVSQSAVGFAQQALQQAQDRFAAGVTDNLEVVQSQESVASSNETLIASLYNYNVAKAALVRAVGGSAEETEKLFTGGLEQPQGVQP